MARPANVTRLVKGELIDVQDGFVDTFNYLVDFCENLIGEGEEDVGKTLHVDRTMPDAPVIRGGGGGGMNLVAGDDTNIVFTPYGEMVKVDVYYR